MKDKEHHRCHQLPIHQPISVHQQINQVNILKECIVIATISILCITLLIHSTLHVSNDVHATEKVKTDISCGFVQNVNTCTIVSHTSQFLYLLSQWHIVIYCKLCWYIRSCTRLNEFVLVINLTDYSESVSSMVTMCAFITILLAALCMFLLLFLQFFSNLGDAYLISCFAESPTLKHNPR